MDGRWNDAARRGRRAQDAVQDAHRLLAAYPIASATPTTHVARHLDNLTFTAAPPSYIQPEYYASYNSNQPQYSDYAPELHYLSGQPSADDSGFWDTTRNDAVRLLGDHAGQFPHPSPGQQWHRPSTYTSNPMAQEIFQRTLPSTAYPTPPPQPIPLASPSSSSLAYALGRPEPPTMSRQASAQPSQSAAFFDQFLAQQRQQIAQKQASQPPPPAQTRQPKLSDGADSLASAISRGISIGGQSKAATVGHVTVTPRKRKAIPVVEIMTPPLKRVQSQQQLAKSVLLPKTPSSSHSVQRTQSATPFIHSPATSVPPTPAMTEYTSTPSTTAPSSSHSQKSPLSRKGTLALSHVEIPRTPTSPNAMQVDGSSSPLKARFDANGNPIILSPTKGLTGQRDNRIPLEKLTAYLEDIFEAEDSLPPDASTHDLPEKWFSPSTTDFSRPILNLAVVNKLLKYIGNVTRPTKRQRTAAMAAGNLITPAHGRSKARMTEVDEESINRILRILMRGVKDAEDIDPFAFGSGPPQTQKPDASPKKANRKNGKAKNVKSTSPHGDEVMDLQEADDVEKIHLEPTEDDYTKRDHKLEVSRDAILGAECCIALLASDRLSKHFYSEELIIQCITIVQSQLKRIIYPFVEASSTPQMPTSPLLLDLLRSNSKTAQESRGILSELFRSISSTLPLITALLQIQGMSESVLIKAVYIAVDPFFVVESQDGDGEVKSRKGKDKDVDNVVTRTFGKSAMRGLRLHALELLRSIFASNEEQRAWIIEEILGSLLKLSDSKQKAGQFRLRDGRSIRTVSALLLQLVQTSAHDVRVGANDIEKKRRAAFTLKRHETLNSLENTSQVGETELLDDFDAQEIALYMSGLESATKAAKTIVLFLNSRSGKGKATKNSNEAEYRTIFDNLMSDLLIVLNWPEWPAASLLLSYASKYMLGSLEDVATSNSSENNAAKTIALDHLGVIAARIRTSHLKMQQEARPLRSLEDIVSKLDTKELDRLLTVHSEIASHLSKRSHDDQAYDSAQELTAATLGQELATCIRRVDGWIEDPDDDSLKSTDRSNLLPFGRKLKGAMRSLWTNKEVDVFDMGSQDDATRVDRLAADVGNVQSLAQHFQPILARILQALQAPPIFARTKGIRALNQILIADPALLSTPKVQKGIEGHLHDSSPAVRDAAVELVGKFMVDSPAMAGAYYEKIADRIADTGLSVRKRVIKLLKSYYHVVLDTHVRADIAYRLITRMHDEDDTVKDLAIKTLEELWFPSTPAPSKVKANDKAVLLAQVSVIMKVAGSFTDRQSPLEDVLHIIIHEKTATDAEPLRRHYTQICEALIDGLVDASDLPGFTVLNCIRTIYFFVSADPSVLTGANASTLLPYLKSATNADDQIISDYLLKIFRVSIPRMPKTTTKFAQDLQTALQPMIIKPTSAAAVAALQEVVACLCSVIRHITHDFHRTVQLLKSIHARLQSIRQRPADKPPTPNELRTSLILINIISLLVEHCDFDVLRAEQPKLQEEIDSITQRSITEHVYNLLLELYQQFEQPFFRGGVLQCLGFIFRAHPTLMTLEHSTTLMDEIFSGPGEEGRARLLRIFQDFLTAEAAKHTAREKEQQAKKDTKAANVDMDELVGNTDGFADSGVSSAIVQRYIERILSAALSQQPNIQAPAVDILSFTVKQGLAHPLQSFPIIVALETSPVPGIRNRASALHSILHTKHTTLINTRYLVSARSSYDYQKVICGHTPVHGFHPDTGVAMLQLWYGLLRDKRPVRQEFLRALSQVYQRPDKILKQDDVDFCRYLAENLSALDFKTLEEVLTVVHYLTAVLSTTGMEVVQHLAPSLLLDTLRSASTVKVDSDQMMVDSDVQTAPPDDQDQRQSLLRSSVIIGMVMLLKAHLKHQYSLSEEKCQKFALGKKSALGDRTAVRKHHLALSWERLPYAEKPMLTTEDLDAQQAAFLHVWKEDGTTAEPEEELLV